MSIIAGKGFLITVMETELECPICAFKFDASYKMDKAKYPTFKTKCPACKGKIGISILIFGGTTECFEWDTNPKYQLITKAPFTVNGKEVIKKPFDDNSDDETENEPTA